MIMVKNTTEICNYPKHKPKKFHAAAYATYRIEGNKLKMYVQNQN